MSPTISTDALAEFIQQLFAEEIEANRQMLASLSKTDMAQYRTELNDASTNTVSYALAGMWSVPGAAGAAVPVGLHPSGAGAGLPPSGEAIILPPSGEVAALPHTGGTGPGTRRLSDAEQAVAMTELDRSGTAFTVLATQRRRTALLLVATLGVLVAVGVGVGLALRGGPLASSDPPMLDSSTARAGRATEATPAAADRGAAAKATADGAVVAAITATDSAGAAAATDASGGPETDARVQMTFEPEHVAKSAQKVVAVKKVRRPRKRRWRRGRRRHAAKKQRPKAPKKPRSVSTGMVQRKFRQVRQEYIRFKRSYGGQLDSHWQQILFANTFGNMDENKHRRLNTLLDSLRRKMKQLSQGG